ncbi:asparaginase [Agromyces sp. SYSU K20354]|uniref:asparaginase domain-containing protein n=1 Tax=Agromyces cavernae TaxID=2898659 RepID=UPI001E4968BB|nr:asparaginase domain-containing protein [Agromyces cavernae]MCD2442023.1 asparaginase [Agromyces cavernae]
MTDQSELVILATGGTIDKTYTLAGELEIGPPAAIRVLDGIATDQTIPIEAVIAKDSLDLTDDDRSRLLARIAEIAADRIVITHGTDTMTDTADYLSEHAPPDKTIVITGALQPAAMSRTDAHFNLGYAIGAAQTSAPGVYIAMSARLFAAGTVTKRTETGKFDLI